MPDLSGINTMLPSCNCVGRAQKVSEMDDVGATEAAFSTWLSARLERERVAMHRYMEDRHSAMLSAVLTKSWRQLELDDAGATISPWVEPTVMPALTTRSQQEEGLDNAMIHGVQNPTSAPLAKPPTRTNVPSSNGQAPPMAVEHTKEQALAETQVVSTSKELTFSTSGEFPSNGRPRLAPGGSYCSETDAPPPLHSPVGRSGSVEYDSQKSAPESLLAHPPRQYKNKNLRAMAGQKDEDPGAMSFFKTISFSKKFEIMSIALIVFQAFLMAIELQYKGLTNGHELGLSDYPKPGADEWPWAEDTFNIAHIIVAIVFSAEIVIRVLGRRRAYLKSIWGIFDLTLITFMWLEVSELIQFKTSYLRLLRLLMIARTAQFFQALNGFDTLFLLVKSLKAGLGAMFWSFTLLFILQCVAGLFMSQILHEVIEDSSYEDDVRVQVFRYFGTFLRTLLTMFEISLSNWVPSCRFFMDNIADEFALFYIIYQNMICFAVVRIIAAIFICETNRIASADDTVAMHRRSQLHAMQIRKLKGLFEELDHSGDGQLDWHEFKLMVEDHLLQQWAHSIEVNTSGSELEELFLALDGGDGKVSMDEFIDGLMNHRGQARSVDVLALRTATRKMETLLERLTGQKPDTHGGTIGRSGTGEQEGNNVASFMAVEQI
mmetsp:Transcript_2487/g.5437  ORF Transcript_2487/g.5437 Transcript_2487/m.5437 type:complete len:661 (-) Transcript_2487:120-2102(-)